MICMGIIYSRERSRILVMGTYELGIWKGLLLVAAWGNSWKEGLGRGLSPLLRFANCDRMISLAFIIITD
jgi:hypothetical protein